MASPPGAARPTAIWAMFTLCLPKIVPTRPMMPGTSLVREDQQHAVEVGFQPVVAELHQPRHVVAEERAGGAEGFFVAW